jgi:hypothetical protein
MPLGVVVACALALGTAALGAPRERYFTSTQAADGARFYGTYCASCHGVDMRGPQAPLVGPAFTSLGSDGGMTLGTFFDFIVRDTPAGRVAPLPRGAYVAIMAYILQRNGYPAGTVPLTFERALHATSRIADARDLR